MFDRKSLAEKICCVLFDIRFGDLDVIEAVFIGGFVRIQDYIPAGGRYYSLVSKLCRIVKRGRVAYYQRIYGLGKFIFLLRVFNDI